MKDGREKARTYLPSLNSEGRKGREHLTNDKHKT